MSQLEMLRKHSKQWSEWVWNPLFLHRTIWNAISERILPEFHFRILLCMNRPLFFNPFICKRVLWQVLITKSFFIHHFILHSNIVTISIFLCFLISMLSNTYAYNIYTFDFVSIFKIRFFWSSCSHRACNTIESFEIPIIQ